MIGRLCSNLLYEFQNGTTLYIARVNYTVDNVTTDNAGYYDDVTRTAYTVYYGVQTSQEMLILVRNDSK